MGNRATTSRTVVGMTDQTSTDPVLAIIPLGDYQTNGFVVADDADTMPRTTFRHGEYLSH